MFVCNRAIRQKRLRDMQGVDVIDSHFGRNVCPDGSERKRSGINHHFSVESGVKRISCAEMDGVFADQVIAVIEVSGRSERREEGMSHKRDGRGIEIEISFPAEKRRIIGGGEDQSLGTLVIRRNHLFTAESERLCLAVERHDIGRVLLCDHTGLQAAP